MTQFKIKEPSEAEFKAFKKEFLAKKSKQYYEPDTKKQIDTLMLIVGKMQSEKDAIKHELNRVTHKVKDNTAPQKFVKVLDVGKKYLPYYSLKMFAHNTLNQLLFTELRNGQFYY